MTSPRLMTSNDVCASLHFSLLRLEELKLQGAPVRVIDGEDRWLFGELVEFVAARESTLWGGVLP